MKFKFVIPILVTASLLTAGCQATTSNAPKQSNVTESSASPTVGTAKRNPILLYSVVDLKIPLTSIPYYSRGEVSVLPETTFKQYDEGHMPTLGDSFTCAVIKTSNLTSEDIVNVNPSEAKNTNTITTKEGILIKRIDKNTFIDGDERKAEYDITVPDVGKYSISAEKPAETDIFFITKISLVMKG
ncbi:hypothetical protein [Paenibacillus alba]|uniref:Lipoprotein n=1 Tax=Paenibacillus alba TaxID=1197127 RepID=A0ABU6G6I4_9BACL|nr:hypothetical protein [Paenibacillus alba]MEC0229766.1 hypothetical protein [Paenibacillus alba]